MTFIPRIRKRSWLGLFPWVTAWSVGVIPFSERRETGTLHSNDILRFTENIDRTTISSLAHRTSGNQKNVFVQRKVLKFKYLKNAKRLNRLRSFLFSLFYKRKFNCKRIIKSVSLVLIIFWLMPSKTRIIADEAVRQTNSTNQVWLQ